VWEQARAVPKAPEAAPSDPAGVEGTAQQSGPTFSPPPGRLWAAVQWGHHSCLSSGKPRPGQVLPAPCSPTPVPGSRVCPLLILLSHSLGANKVHFPRPGPKSSVPAIPPLPPHPNTHTGTVSLSLADPRTYRSPADCSALERHWARVAHCPWSGRAAAAGQVGVQQPGRPRKTRIQAGWRSSSNPEKRQAPAHTFHWPCPGYAVTRTRCSLERG